MIAVLYAKDSGAKGVLPENYIVEFYKLTKINPEIRLGFIKITQEEFNQQWDQQSQNLIDFQAQKRDEERQKRDDQESAEAAKKNKLRQIDWSVFTQEQAKELKKIVKFVLKES